MSNQHVPPNRRYHAEPLISLVYRLCRLHHSRHCSLSRRHLHLPLPPPSSLSPSPLISLPGDWFSYQRRTGGGLAAERMCDAGQAALGAEHFSAVDGIDLGRCGCNNQEHEAAAASNDVSVQQGWDLEQRSSNNRSMTSRAVQWRLKLGQPAGGGDDLAGSSVGFGANTFPGQIRMYAKLSLFCTWLISLLLMCR